MKKITMDGNYAASNIAYMFNDVAVIYPITPSSPMAENCDQFQYENRKNIFGNKLCIKQMQSEAGVAGAVHGSLIAGAKTTTFTSSQGLLLMIPNMYKIAGEGLPTVFYVASRSLATHALNIFCDYSDIYACLKTGFNIVSCSSVQEVNDMAIACELASIKSNIPYICFFDGFRTSHEINTVEMTELDDLRKILNPAYLCDFKNKALNNHEPYCAGTNQNPDVFMQNRIKSLEKYSNAISNFRWALNEQEKITSRKYDTIEYCGDPNATDVVVTMGSSADVLMLAKRQYKGKVGIIKVRMFKPFDEHKFISLLPKKVKNVTVLERNLDVNGLDSLTGYVMSILQKYHCKAKVYSGCFGLGGKEFTPDMAMAVFENMKKRKKEFFTVGIYDDVSHTNLEVLSNYNDDVEFAMRMYGLGSDGTVSSMKNTIKILGEETDKFVQGYFDYDSKKSGSLTISHMRLSDKPIVAPFNPQQVNFVVCNNEGYIEKYDLTDCLKTNGTLLINTGYDIETLNKLMTNKLKKDIIEKRISVYTINANLIAKENNLGDKVNTIMQTAMFYLSKLIPFEIASDSIKNKIVSAYSKKGEELVKNNLNAIENIEAKLNRIDTNKLDVKQHQSCQIVNDEFYENIIYPTSVQNGDKIPVSKFEISGRMPTDTARFNKQSVAKEIPKWIKEKCIQCGRCALMCPHSAIRPVVLDKNAHRPKIFETQKAYACEGDYRLQIMCRDCTGCGVCSTVCPVKALIMTPSQEIRDKENSNVEFMLKLKENTPFELNSVKGLQFKKPYFEFSGACAGCGETPYIKLASQLFGDRMIIANATGCSSIYGGTFPTCPYAKDKQGFGPSWANSLFEDNAEFGYGIAVARRNQRENFINSLKNMRFSKKIDELLQEFLKNPENHENNKNLILKLKEYRKGHIVKGDEIYLFDNLSLITSPSIWIFGGDGWAYDIGFGGLDHVVSTGENVNILILDTEVYSNTGGQSSKATPRGATAKFNLSGKTTKKKDLASMLMTYKDVYVAHVSIGANPEQAVKAFIEAENYNGPSVIIAYSPCVNHGYDMRYSQLHAMNSVKSGYNTLFRYNPTKAEPMHIDSFEPTMKYEDYVETENRFAILAKVNKKDKNKLIKQSEQDAKERNQTYKNK